MSFRIYSFPPENILLARLQNHPATKHYTDTKILKIAAEYFANLHIPVNDLRESAKLIVYKEREAVGYANTLYACVDLINALKACASLSTSEESRDPS